MKYTVFYVWLLSHMMFLRFIHAAACVCSMVLSTAELNLSVWIHHKVCTHQLMHN